MAALAIQKITKAGTTPSYGAAAGGGDTVATDGSRRFLHVKNGGAGSITVTIDRVKPCDQGFDHDLSVAVAAGTERLIGPLPTEEFGANAAVTYSGVTSVTVAALELP